MGEHKPCLFTGSTPRFRQGSRVFLVSVLDPHIKPLFRLAGRRFNAPKLQLHFPGQLPSHRLARRSVRELRSVTEV